MGWKKRGKALLLKKPTFKADKILPSQSQKTSDEAVKLLISDDIAVKMGTSQFQKPDAIAMK